MSAQPSLPLGVAVDVAPRWQPLLDFKIWGEPIPYGRPTPVPPPVQFVKAWARNGFRGPPPMPRTLTPGKTRVYMREVKIACGRAMRVYRCPGIDAEALVKVEADFVFRRRAADYRRRDPDGRILKYTRGDVDNIAKCVLDGMEKARLYPDDAQVVLLRASKWWGAIQGDRRDRKSELPHAHVRVFVLDTSPNPGGPSDPPQSS